MPDITARIVKSLREHAEAEAAAALVDKEAAKEETAAAVRAYVNPRNRKD